MAPAQALDYCEAKIAEQHLVHIVIPAKAGIQDSGAHHATLWIPAFAGMTIRKQVVMYKEEEA
jgi:hypothetical protein